MSAIIGAAAAVPLFALVVRWGRRQPRDRSTAVGQALGAAVLSIVLLILGGAVVDVSEARAAMFMPVIIGGAVVAATLNRKVHRL